MADEVRNLAMRAAEASRHTAGLIEGSVGKIRRAMQICVEMDRALQGNAVLAQKTATLVAEIAEASEEQARGVEQIREAMTQMDAVTQRTAAGSEESNAAAESMRAQAGELEAIVSGLARIVSGGKANKEAKGGKALPSPKPSPTPPAHHQQQEVSPGAFRLAVKPARLQPEKPGRASLPC